MTTDWFGDETEDFALEVDAAISSAMVPFTTLKPSEWCEQNLFIPAGRSSIPGKLKLYPYQKQVLDALADPKNRRIVIPKGSRTGYNLILACWQIYCACNSRDPIVSLHPTEKGSRTHEETIRGLILNSPNVFRLIPDMEKQRWDHKRFLTGAELFFKEATKPSNFAEYSARNAAADEVDRPQWADGGESISEGEKLDLLETRLAAYVPFGLDKMAMGASPGSDSTSRIWPRYMLTDQQKLFMECHACGEWDYLKWGGRETDFGVKWGDDPKKAVYVCEHCGGIWSEKDRKAALRTAEFRPTAVGLPGWVGFHMTGMMSPFWSLGDLAAAFDKGTKMAGMGRFGSLQAFINTKLGETWKDREAKAPAKIHVLQERLEHYTAEVPAEVLFIAAFADTQEGKEGEPGYHEVGFYGFGHHEQMWHIGQFIVREHGLDDERHWRQLEALLMREWKHASGRNMRAAVAGVDTGSGKDHHTARVVQFCNDGERAGRMWYATKGYSNQKGERLGYIWPRDTSAARKGGYMFVVDTYTAKDRIFERLKRAPGEPGSIHFPAAHLEGAMPLDATFFKRLTKERPKVIPGQDGTSWANQPKDQEPWDTLVGCYTLLHALYTKPGGAKLRIRLNADKAEQAPQVEGVEAVNVDAAPTPTPAAKPAPVDADMPPPGTPPWKMTPAQRAAVQAAKDREEATKPKPAGKRGGFQMVRSSFVSR